MVPELAGTLGKEPEFLARRVEEKFCGESARGQLSIIPRAVPAVAWWRARPVLESAFTVPRTREILSGIVFARTHEERMRRLAKRFDAVAERDRIRMKREKEIVALRMNAARDLHALCGRFVSAINQLVESAPLDLTPPAFRIDDFDDLSVHLIQINASGRMVQFTFHGTADLESTEEIKLPYTLEGEARWFSQELLDRDDVNDHQIFFCNDKGVYAWRYYDPRSHKMGLIDEDYLASLFEDLV